MAANSPAYQGCLLGLAVGDALGFTIDSKTWEQIQSAYGPNGLLGYDLQEDYASVSSHTQIAAYLCNALLLSISRKGIDNRMVYVSLGLKEWGRSQQFYRDPEHSYCWIAKLPAFRQRNCRDPRMLDVIRLQKFGTPEKPLNQNDAPGALTEAIAIGMFYDSKRMTPMEIGELSVRTTALTHGDKETQLAGVVLSYAIAGLLQDPEVSLKDQYRQAIQVMQGQFPCQEAADLAELLEQAFLMARETDLSILQGMEQLHCETAAQCLAGAMFVTLACPDDFDTAIIGSVNHSGCSAATGAIVGAVLGARLGADALPDFYAESIENRDALITLAEDVLSSTPASGLFDDDWDQKYVQGEPL